MEQYDDEKLENFNTKLRDNTIVSTNANQEIKSDTDEIVIPITSPLKKDGNPCEKCQVTCPQKCLCFDELQSKINTKRPCGRCEVDCPEKCVCDPKESEEVRDQDVKTVTRGSTYIYDFQTPFTNLIDTIHNPCDKCQVICPQICKCLDPIAQINPRRPCGRCEVDCPKKCTCKDPLFITMQQFKCTLCAPGQCTCGKKADDPEFQKICHKIFEDASDKQNVCVCKDVCLCTKSSDCTCAVCVCQNRHRPTFIPGTKMIALNEQPENIYFTAQMNQLQKRADEYLKKHHIFEFLHYLMSQLLAHLPANPVEFLLKLLKDILTYRLHKTIPAPVLFEERHLESIYKAMDPMQMGVISINQYVLGLKTIGLRTINRDPPLTYTGMVTKNIFLDEARKRQIWQLDDLIEVVKAPVKPKKIKSNKKYLKKIGL